MLERRDSGDRRRVPLLRRRRAHDARRGRRRVPAGLHEHDPPRSGRRGRVHRAVELSADDGGLEAGAGARRRQHRGASSLPSRRRSPTLKLATHLRRAVSAGRRQHRSAAAATPWARRSSRSPSVAMISLTGDVSHRREGARRPPRKARSARIWSWAARRRSSCSTTRTSSRVVGGVRTFGFYNAGQDCTAACRIYAGPKIYDKLVADLSERGQQHQGRHAGGRGRRDGAAHQRRSSASAWRASSSARPRSSTSRSPPAARRAAAAGSSSSRRSIAGAKQTRRDRAEGSVRAGGLRHALQGCGPGDRVGERFRLRPRVIRVDARTWARRCRSPRACSTAAPGSTRTSCS